MTQGNEGVRAEDLAALAHDAVIWGMPLMMLALYLDAPLQGAVPFNRFLMNDKVATPGSAAIGPNIDTLNGRAWLDLSEGPVIIGVPDTAERYYSVQLQDMYMNSFAYIGRRTTGTAAGFFAITPPGFTDELPAGVAEVRATSDKVLAFVRTMVQSPEDLPNAVALNGRFTLGTSAEFPAGQHPATVRSGALDAFQPANRLSGKSMPHQDLAAMGSAYFDRLAELVRMFPPLPGDAPQLARFAPLHLDDSTARTAALAAILHEAVAPAIAAIPGALVAFADNGWSRRPNVAMFIDDPVQRAANNVFGPNTQVAEESVFFNKRFEQGQDWLNGAYRYRLRFPPGGTPPVDAFWSLTLYDKSYVLFDNVLDRYGILDRTAGLEYGADGSLEIQIQADEPAEGPANWLPSPRGEFQLVIRTYQPRAEVLDRSYLPPPLERI